MANDSTSSQARGLMRIKLKNGFRGYGVARATFANEQITGFRCHGATGATLGLPVPTGHSLDYIGLGLLGLPWGYLCQPEVSSERIGFETISTQGKSEPYYASIV